MNIVEQFIRDEESKRNWLQKRFNYYPPIYFAKDIKTEIVHYEKGQVITVKPSKSKRVLASLFFCLGFFTWLMVLNMIIYNILLPISILFLVLVSFWIGFVLWRFFLSSKYSYKITFTDDSLIIGSETIEWEQISEYLLLQKPQGRDIAYILVLFIENKEVRRCYLENLNTSGEKIIKLIELYSKKANNDRFSTLDKSL